MQQFKKMSFCIGTKPQTSHVQTIDLILYVDVL